MRGVAACFAVGVVLAGCSSTQGSRPAPPLSAPPLPATVGNGIGSEYGNYGGRFDGETRSPTGDRCYVFNWDRPLTKDLAIRYISTSCESKEHPLWMSTTTFTRKVIPISESNLKDERIPQ